MSKITITALVTGSPPELRRPKPLPGENIFQLVIRNHLEQWQNCIERLKKDFNVDDEICSSLLRGEQFELLDIAVKRVIARFMNHHLPTQGRTLEGIADLRKELEKPGFRDPWNIQLTEIIWPRLKNPNVDKQTENVALSFGVTIVEIEQELISLGIGSFMDQIHGDYIWILPAGTQLLGNRTETGLLLVLTLFKENPRLALYSDQCYCVIYRTSALRALIESGKKLSSENRDNARMLEEAGFELAADNDPIHNLVKLESIYGGKCDSNRKK